MSLIGENISSRCPITYFLDRTSSSSFSSPYASSSNSSSYCKQSVPRSIKSIKIGDTIMVDLNGPDMNYELSIIMKQNIDEEWTIDEMYFKLEFVS